MIMRSKLFRAALFSAALAASAAAGATSVAVNYSDLWAKPDEPGWGLNISQQADVLFATLFIYDKFSNAAWYSVTLNFDSIGAGGVRKYTGVLYQTTGSPITQPYDPNALQYRQVGNLSMEFGDPAHAILTYTVDGAAQAKQVTRLTFATDTLLGSYVGSTQDVTYDCRNPARNGLVTTDTGPFTITQNEQGLTMKFPTCTITDGVYVQQGQIGQVDAIYTCLGGAAGEIKFTAMRSEQGGIVGTYTGKDGSCSFRGNIGGARAVQ